MKKYKVCPLCEEKNEPDALVCSVCELPLDDVEPIEEADDTAPEATPAAEPENTAGQDEKPATAEASVNEEPGNPLHVISDSDFDALLDANWEKEESDSEPEPEVKPEPEPEAKPEAKPEEKSEAKPEAKPEEKPEAKPEAEPAPAPSPEPEVKPQRPSSRKKPRKELEDSGVSFADKKRASGNASYVINCDCGHANPFGSIQCEVCGEYIGNLIPQMVRSEGDGTAPDTAVFLVEAEEIAAYVEMMDIPGKDVVVIGRQTNFRKYLEAKNYVSRRHARLFIKEGSLYIEDLGSTNGTFIDGARLRARTTVLLKDGARFVLGGLGTSDGARGTAAFTVRRVK